MIEPDRPSNRLEEGVGGVLAKRESVPLGSVPCHVDDGVSQAARGADDRDRAVAEADHLSQTTRLELRGHQEEIGTCVDPMREGLVILQPDHQVAPYSGELGHRFFVLLLPRAKEDELDSLVQDLRERIDQDVEPFLRRDPRDVSDQRRLRILGEARLLPKGSLVRSLSFQGGFRVLLDHEGGSRCRSRDVADGVVRRDEPPDAHRSRRQAGVARDPDRQRRRPGDDRRQRHLRW